MFRYRFLEPERVLSFTLEYLHSILLFHIRGGIRLPIFKFVYANKFDLFRIL